MLQYNLEMLLFFLPLLIVATFGSQECGQPRINQVQHSHVEKMENATEGQWPWMVTLTQRDRPSGNYEPKCGGFLIDRKHVLTAAECLSRRPTGRVQNRRYSTLIGSVDLKKSKVYSIENIVVHKGYTSGRFYNDIAVLTLRREVDLPNFTPICLPDEKIINKCLVDMGTTEAGWLLEKLGRKNITITLKHLSGISVMSPQDCNDLLHRVGHFGKIFPKGLTSDIMCAGYVGGRYCVGASGSPLMFQERNKWFAVGIGTFGNRCGEIGALSGYTRISSYLEWIRQNTKN